MKRFCNHCGQLYEGERCPCRKKVKREYKHNDFYSTEAWVACSRYARIRDYSQDRLQLYFTYNNPANRIEKQIYDYIMDETGNPRRFEGRNIVHHIVEINKNWELRYHLENLITLNFYTHEYIHKLYSDGYEKEVQVLLQKAIAFEI